MCDSTLATFRTNVQFLIAMPNIQRGVISLSIANLVTSSTFDPMATKSFGHRRKRLKTTITDPNKLSYTQWNRSVLLK